jgi:hypothetical protein
VAGLRGFSHSKTKCRIGCRANSSSGKKLQKITTFDQCADPPEEMRGGSATPEAGGLRIA